MRARIGIQNSVEIPFYGFGVEWSTVMELNVRSDREDHAGSVVQKFPAVEERGDDAAIRLEIYV